MRICQLTKLPHPQRAATFRAMPKSLPGTRRGEPNPTFAKTRQTWAPQETSSQAVGPALRSLQSWGTRPFKSAAYYLKPCQTGFAREESAVFGRNSKADSSLRGMTRGKIGTTRRNRSGKEEDKFEIVGY